MSSKRSSSISISADTVIGSDDLLIEILTFLPAKSLVRFKYVNKRWRSLISAPSFCRRHTIHHSLDRPQTQLLFILGGNYGLVKYVVYNPIHHRFFAFPPNYDSSLEIVQSCNGLLLVRRRKAEDDDSHTYFVLNPTTMHRRELSPLPTSNSVGAIYLMFDPSLSPHFRVVSFLCANDCALVYVYVSETHTWKLEGERKNRATIFRGGIYFNGGIHFVGFPSSFRFIPDNIVTKIQSPPRHFALGCSKNYIMESNGVVYSLTLSWKWGKNLLRVAEMRKNDGYGWRKKWRINMKRILATCERERKVDCRDIHLLCVINDEKERGLMLLLIFDEKLIIYRFRGDSFVVAFELNPDDNEKEQYAYHFIHTLAPV